jgi:hypothetical protein
MRKNIGREWAILKGKSKNRPLSIFAVFLVKYKKW